MERKLTVFLVVGLWLIMGGMGSGPAWAQISDADGLVLDIPEPPGAKQELPSPIPMIYEFVGGLMGGDQDRCLSHFDVPTFLAIIFGAPLRRLSPAEYQELFAYQVQVQRNEFRFLSRIMHRMAKDAKFNYSNPRFHNNVQCKVVVQMRTTKGNHTLELYARYANERWAIYDYILDGKRFTQSFKEGLGNLKLDGYIASLRPFYDDFPGTRTIRNDEYGISLKVPSRFQVKEKLSPNLLASVTGLDGQFLLHVQAAQYSTAQTLSQVAAEIKNTILPFNPRLYDQWKTDIAGVDIGHVLFQFEKNGKTLFTHMVIIPMGKKLVVLNFYHGTLPLMKHMTNIRDKIFDSLTLTRIEGRGGELSLPGDDLGLPASPATGEMTPPPPAMDEPEPMAPPPPQEPPEIPPPGPDEEPEIDTGEPPPPPGAGNATGEDQPEGDDYPPPPPPEPNADYLPPDESGGSEVSF